MLAIVLIAVYSIAARGACRTKAGGQRGQRNHRQRNQGGTPVHTHMAGNRLPLLLRHPGCSLPGALLLTVALLVPAPPTLPCNRASMQRPLPQTAAVQRARQ